MRRVCIPALMLALFWAGCESAPKQPQGAGSEIARAPAPGGSPGLTAATQPRPAPKPRVVYRFQPGQIDPQLLKKGVVVREGLPAGVETGVAATGPENRWSAKHIHFVPGKEMLTVTERTHVRFRYKLTHDDEFQMQFLCDAREDTVKYRRYDAEQDKWVELTVSLYDDMGFEEGEDVSELSWHMGDPGFPEVTFVVCDVVFFEKSE